MKGKEKCKALKEIRSKIAEENDIEYIVSECSHKGDCKGTCPKCEAELRYLEKELEKRQSLGKKVVLTGLSVGMAAAISGCSPETAEFMVSPVGFFTNPIEDSPEAIAGDETYIPPEDELLGEEIDQTVELDGEYVECPTDEPDSDDGVEIEELDGDVVMVLPEL